jgi:hypothetical protein
MKTYIKTISLIVFNLIAASCSQNNSNAERITITIDPNKQENRYQIINIISADSIKEFMKNLDDKEREPVKFFPRYEINIIYKDKSESFYGSGNHIKDSQGRTYKLLKEEWYPYNY